jgi:tRNA threonylcarbamoyl adenosine modification protein (Sua5/YciO/YrdC/YwlC family)
VGVTFDCSQRGGQLVVLPTDSSYGVGCDAFSSQALRRLREAKRRGPDMPVPVLVGSWAAVDGLMLGVPSVVRELVEAFWPGGLSLVLTHAPSLAWELGDTRGTVVVRMPLHLFALELLGEVGPMAVSGANTSGNCAAAPMAAA